MMQIQQTKTRNNVNNTILLLSRHTTSSKAKSKEPQGPGSTLRLRNMLAKRNHTPLLRSNTVVC